MKLNEAADYISKYSVPRFPSDADIDKWAEAMHLMNKALNGYDGIVKQQAFNEANALRSLMCKEYCLHHADFKKFQITLDTFNEKCRNCPFVDIKEVYR